MLRKAFLDAIRATSNRPLNPVRAINSGSKLNSPNEELYNFNRNQSYFDMFRLRRKFDVDLQQLSREFKNLQRVFHPDKFANKSQEERDVSAELSSLVNKAYQTLVDDHKRGLYLLKLHGQQIAEDEQEVELTGQFLEQMMEINEQLACRDTLSETKLAKLREDNNRRIKLANEKILASFESNNLKSAKEALAELKFYKNLAEKIKDLS